MRTVDLKKLVSGRSRGFTLIEALFSMAVILVGILAVFGLFQTGLSSLTGSSVKMQASLLATNLFEELKSIGYDNLPGSDTVANLVAAHPGRITAFPPPFGGDVAVTDVSEDMNGDGANDYRDKAGNTTLREIALTLRAPGVRFKEVIFRMRMTG